jgi:hypothetical protein
MVLVVAECSDGKTKVTCLNSIFHNAVKYCPDITVRELQEIDTIYNSLGPDNSKFYVPTENHKKLTPTEMRDFLQGQGWIKLFRMIEITSALGIHSVKAVIQSAIDNLVSSIKTPIQARKVFPVESLSLKIPQNTMVVLDQIFAEILDLSAFHQIDEQINL